MADEPHHDGSELYTSSGPYALGDTIEVRLRVPNAASADRVRVRSTPNAEPLLVDAQAGRADDVATWWVANLELHNPVTSYRFLLEGGDFGYGWVTQAGVSHRDVSDANDFVVSTELTPPAWLDQTIGYQIFIDRFARSATEYSPPSWAIGAAWDEPLADDPDIGTRQWYRGDLPGVEQHLDHLQRLGVTLVYLTPFFPSDSAHRYDAASFDHVDPVLGGDAALASLIEAAHLRGIRVIGDVTLNHTGDRHQWFRSAQADRSATEAGFYLFGDSGRPDDYVSWHGVTSLPKLDHRSDDLANRLYRSDDSVIARYLDRPFGLDGWRVDCANTTGRWADTDLTHTVAAGTLATVERHRPEAWLLAEHCYDAATDLRGGGWHGVMAYQWFTRPLWSWLRGEQPFSLMSQIDVPLLDGAAVVASMRELAATVPWAARRASMTMLDSHDSARFRTAVGGSHERHVVGVVALMTMPGVPTLFAGSEIGVEGDSTDSARVPFPWSEPEAWDDSLLDIVERLARIRATSPALQRGSLRWIDADADSITFVREVSNETVLVRLNRRDTEPTSVVAADVGPGEFATLFGPPASADRDILTVPGNVGATIVQFLRQPVTNDLRSTPRRTTGS